MTHKGEVEIDRDYNETLDKTNEFDSVLPPLRSDDKMLASPSKKEKKKGKKKEEAGKKETISNAEHETIQRMLDAKSKVILVLYRHLIEFNKYFEGKS